MKPLNFIILFISIIYMSSCEDVVELDLPESDKRLVVDGWLTNLSEVQTIKLSYTGPYFESAPTPKVTNAVVTVYDNEGNTFNMIEEEPGIYKQNFIPQIGRSYTLEITTGEGEEYVSAPEVMDPVPALEQITYEFREKTAFEDEGYYVFINLTDPEDQENYYRWKYYVNDILQNDPDNLIIERDELIDGSELRDIQFNYEPLEVGDKVRIEQASISEGAYNFIIVVRDQLTSGRGTFDAPPAPVIGNVRNKNSPDETVLGYFGVSDVDYKEILIEEIP